VYEPGEVGVPRNCALVNDPAKPDEGTTLGTDQVAGAPLVRAKFAVYRLLTVAFPLKAHAKSGNTLTTTVQLLVAITPYLSTTLPLKTKLPEVGLGLARVPDVKVHPEGRVDVKLTTNAGEALTTKELEYATPVVAQSCGQLIVGAGSKFNGQVAVAVCKAPSLIRKEMLCAPAVAPVLTVPLTAPVVLSTMRPVRLLRFEDVIDNPAPPVNVTF
jgi:hypothetical protein